MIGVKVLLAEDDRDHRRLLTHALQRAQPEVEFRTASTRWELVEALTRQRFDCVVIDFHLADASADRLILDHGSLFRGAPVVVVSSSDDQRVVIESLRCGVADFVPKFDAIAGDTLWRRVEAAIHASRQARAERRVAERRARRLERIAETDSLTGLSNRRYLDRLLSAGRFVRDRRANSACCMIDLDRFKSINDEFGHAFGDAVLRVVAGAIRTATPGGTAVRWGGEEFLIVRHEPTAASAWAWAEGLRRRIAGLNVRDGSAVVRPTVSVGMVFTSTRDLGPETINRADHALYLAKDRGRNTVATWEMVVAEELAENVALTPGPIRRRRDALIRQLSDRLGPAQRSHMTEHCERVSEVSIQLADAMSVPPGETERIGLAGLLHDVGKAVIPEELLSLPRGLTDDERAIMDRHAEEGAQIASRLGADPWVESGVRRHHARFDTSPPLAARVVGVADALVAMTTDRPYRAARSHAEALAEMRRWRGGQFDPDAVEAAQLIDAHLLTRAA